MGICLSKRDVYDKNEYPLVSPEEESSSGAEKSSSCLGICVEMKDMNSCSHLFGIPKKIQSPPSKLLGLFMKRVSPVRSKVAICDGPKIPKTPSEHARTIEDDDLFPRLTVVKSGNSVISSRSAGFPALMSTEEPSAAEKCQAFQMGSGWNTLLTEDYIMKSGLRDHFKVSKRSLIHVENEGNNGTFRGVNGSQGIIKELGEKSSEEIQSHHLEGGEAFGSPFSIDSCEDAELHQGAEIIASLQQPRYNSDSHQGQQDAFVTGTTELPYSGSCQDNGEEFIEGGRSNGITAHSKQCEIAENLTSSAAVADPECAEDASSESSSDLFEIVFHSSDVVIGPVAVSESAVVI